ncbi:MAG: tetratricopeptide repeat protein [Chloroflexi bacterium]|nr:MAG: tetratricopeptide repeat protein [Chloroflexota bacterium]
MTDKSRKKASLRLTQARKYLADMRDEGDPRKISVAAANLGFALFSVNKFKEGLRSFNEVDQIFKELDDFILQVHCLGIKTMAYQSTDQHPQAFKTAHKIENLAVAKQNERVQCDALATQGQILIDSGEEVIALEKLNAALEIAEKIGDKRRQMNVTGAFGNYCMTIASADKAEAYFVQARDLARELEDRQAEIGFHGNLGALLEWKGEFLEAGQIFDDVVTFVHEIGNKKAELQAYRHLINVHTKLNDNEKVVAYAQKGVALAKETNDAIANLFYEHLIAAFYRLNLVTKARRATMEALEFALTSKDRNQEINLLLGLGESYMITNELEKSLGTYQQALMVTQRLQRMTDKAYLLGRIGIILAELNRTDEAVRHHELALELARKHDLLDLEGEQLVMLAMAFADKGDVEKARGFCETAVSIYTKANLTEQADKARNLLAKLV